MLTLALRAGRVSFAVAAGVGIAVLIIAAVLRPPEPLPQVSLAFSDGKLLSRRSLAPDGRFIGAYVQMSELPAHVWQAIVAIEDRRFFHHYGVDPLGVLRALVVDLSRGRASQGGSTITQQLARNLYLSQRKYWPRKVAESLIAFAMEARWGKQAILEQYINTIYFGHEAYGLAAAAELYFAKTPAQLDLAEAAMIAGLIQSPGRLSPLDDLAAAKTRAEIVLSDMAQQHFISQRAEQFARAKLSGLAAKSNPLLREYIADAALAELRAKAGHSLGNTRRLFVRTTVDYALQNAAEQSVLRNINASGERLKFDAAALLALGDDGAIQAMVGGTDYRQSRFNLATRAHRQPGSSFKPFLYLAALERGATPDDRFLDAPDKTKDWFPQNANRSYSYEWVTLNEGLSRSLNSVAARLCYAVTPRRVVEVAQRLGITSPLSDNVTIALGTSEVTIAEMTTAYVVFSNGGFKTGHHLINEVRDQDGQLLFRATRSERQRVLGAREVRLMNGMLSDVVRHGTGSRANIPGQYLAGKTGTTQSNRDAWFIGFNASITAAVWLGNLDGAPMHSVAGSQLPALIWRSFMIEATKNEPARPLPGDVATTGTSQ